MIVKPRMRFGKVVGEPNDVYHADEAVSRSKLDAFARQPLYYYRKYVEKSLKEDFGSASLRVGSASHALVLEGQDAYDRDFIVLPEDAPRRPTPMQINAKNPSPETVKAVQWWSDFNARAAGKVPLTAEEDTQSYRVLRSVREHPTAATLFASGQPEISWRVQLPQYAIQCRSDWFNQFDGCDLTNGEPYVVDFKTVASLDADEFGNFERGFFSLGYYRQGPFYNAVISEVLGFPIKHFFFVVTEKKEPFETRVFRPTERAMSLGWTEVKADLNRLAECYSTGVWPGSPAEILSIDVPDWYVRKAAALTQEVPAA